MRTTWVDVVIAASSAVTAAATVGLFIAAVAAWRTARATLEASRRASEAAQAASEAAAEANEQARRDSIERTRPYVYVEVVPSLAGTGALDLRVHNAGRSAAHRLTLDYDSWPDELDDIGIALQTLFHTPRTLPPGCSIRTIWRAEGRFDDGTTEAGLGREGRVSVRYTSADGHDYADEFDVQVDTAGLWPIPEEGPEPDGLDGRAKAFYRLGQTLVRRIGELGR